MIGKSDLEVVIIIDPFQEVVSMKEVEEEVRLEVEEVEVVEEM